MGTQGSDSICLEALSMSNDKMTHDEQRAARLEASPSKSGQSRKHRRAVAAAKRRNVRKGRTKTILQTAAAAFKSLHDDMIRNIADPVKTKTARNALAQLAATGFKPSMLHGPQCPACRHYEQVSLQLRAHNVPTPVVPSSDPGSLASDSSSSPNL
jgi:hypothetical protein